MDVVEEEQDDDDDDDDEEQYDEAEAESETEAVDTQAIGVTLSVGQARKQPLLRQTLLPFKSLSGQPVAAPETKTRGVGAPFVAVF